MRNQGDHEVVTARCGTWERKSRTGFVIGRHPPRAMVQYRSGFMVFGDSKFAAA